MRGQRVALAAMIAALVAPLALGAQTTTTTRPDTSIRVGEFMTPDEAAATGVANMTAAQRAAFEQWLDRYTSLVMRVARRDAPAARPMERTVFHRPAYLRNTPHVAELLNGGDFVRLEDGSVWEIYAPDRVATAAWKAGNTIVVRPRSVAINVGNRQYDTLLENGEVGTTATARYRGTGMPEELDTRGL